MGCGVLLVVLVLAETCWALSHASSPSSLAKAGSGSGSEAGVRRGSVSTYDLSDFKGPFIVPAVAYKRQYDFGLGKRAVDYEDDAEEDPTLADEDALDADKRARSYEFGLGKRARPYSFGLGKRARSYEFGLGKRSRAYEFGLGKRGASGERRLYSFGLGKRLPAAERRYAFGLGKRSDVDFDELVDADGTWQSSPADTRVVAKREVAPLELKEVADEKDRGEQHEQLSPRSKRAAPMQYNFGLGKRMSEEVADSLAELEDAQVQEAEDDDEDAMARAARAGKQYEFGLGKRARSYEFGLGKRERNYAFGLGKRASRTTYDSGKRGPRQYGFGLGRRSMQYNFGIGKRSVGTEAAPAAPAAASTEG